VLATQGAAEFAIQTGYLQTLLTQYEYDPALKPVIFTASRNVPIVKDIMRGAGMYRVWGRSFQEMHRKMFETLTRKGARGKYAAARKLAQIWVFNTISQVLVRATLGNLPKKDDDDDYMDMVKNAALATFDPSSYGGMYNVSLLMPVLGNYINPFLYKDILAGETIRDVSPYDWLQGQAGGMVVGMVTAIANTIAYFNAEDEAQRKKIRAAILNEGEFFLRSNFLFYKLANRAMTLATGARKINLVREIATQFDWDEYDLKKEERNVFENIQYFLYEKNKPYIGGKEKFVYQPPSRNISGRSRVGRPKGSR
jgi:hypothetical protein